jgi:hypothetical protein
MKESWEEWRRKGKLAKSTMEEREAYFMHSPRRKKGYLYPPPTKYGSCRILGRIIRPPGQKSAQKSAHLTG